jgi:hypothetical protein
MIIRPVLFASWGEMLRSPVRLALLALFFLPAIVVGAFTAPGAPSSGSGALYAVILGAGLIGRPATNGTLALLFTRPVRRSSYVLTRWLAVWVAAGSLAMLRIFVLTLEAVRASGFDGSALAVASLEEVLEAAGVAAILVLLSSLIGGIGDAAVLVMLMIAGAILQQVGRFLSQPALNKVGFHLEQWVSPKIDLVAAFGTTPISWYALVSYVSTVVVSLVLAMELLNRKEVSYASSGD